jgi:gamma-glutamyltranspeptidase/glutathione hydrolase
MNVKSMRCVVALLALLAVPHGLFAQGDAAPEAARGSIEVEHGAVVSAQRDASEVGVDVLKRGGNAVDAAVATAFALAVTHPEAGNIGGGGFMLVFPGDGRAPVCVDYRETAPVAATATMFTPGENRFTCKYVGVPGTVRGLELAHREFGKLPWSELVAPAVKLAKDGFALDKYLADSLNELLKESPEFVELQRAYGKDGGKAEWREGDRLVLPELGKSLRAIAEHGPNAFYDGVIAEQLVAEMKSGDGLISRDDLRGYQAKLREPIRGVYRGYDIYAAPPPSSGGICLIEMLNILEPLELRKHGRHSAEAMHFTIEAMQRAFCRPY